jgi:uncharacterized membrane protein
MADGSIGGLMQQSGLSIPKISGAGLTSVLIWTFVALIVVIALGGAFFMYYQRVKFNKRVYWWKSISGRNVCVNFKKPYMAKLERVGFGGDYWFFIKDLKKRMPRPKIWITDNVVFLFEREDGEVVDWQPGNIDKLMKESGAYYVDEDMRLQRLGIQKNLDNRLVKQGFWKQYGATIMMVIFILAVTIALVVLFKEMKEIPPALTESAKAISEMANAIKDMQLGGGGGMKPL